MPGLRLLVFIGLMSVMPLLMAFELVPQRMQFEDGGSALYYVFDKHLAAAEDTEAALVNVMFVVAGAGCRSMGSILPAYFTGFEGESGRSRIFVLQKRFIAALSDGQRCSAEFVRADHLSQWRADQLAFIRARLAELGGAPQRVVLFGISEGAELLPLLAAALPQTTHLVLLSHSGMNAGTVYRALAAEYPHMARGWQQLQAALALRPADPTQLLIHGRSWLYWDEILNLPQSQGLLESNLPILLGVGEADSLIPPHSLDKLQQLFASAGSQRLVIRGFPQADHGLQGPYRNYLADFMWQFELWLQEGNSP
ncbi:MULTISPECIES: acyl-CoA thioester hydrolase/BAAT C-terminal domain-containing protein [unclassified Undibacterium]|uniref:alpha/beta hydrolase family protein n=1 Tax=unclassified Undibacterium TaxID=2630295 RepID=UPI002AC96758|nr:MULTISPECIES: acyl-CoA thioester hydrolase/BAAT C-terminal domain-containing protein [unclassified Undibacterium]MEB0139759.1 acyl-CoA thioester hydrolase/BAAT C-terminal domain-containing protein [Undibacterium sp. CCC2.1]MEB0172640.1 acyl-CoA thioester hydrolase/BAAT C-terminal domain-containing protein [Undibacterium sp. CCC1.1]MEB0176379.1 acyl-CoA thioester hydrolase/BAAT C-terminal domain-containing protein [Undibacterium sp. CCC3.4]MEB0215763.1 acyl-CoA thioester hydrolase/BAAT C-term